MKKLLFFVILFTSILSAQITITEKFTGNKYDSTKWTKYYYKAVPPLYLRTLLTPYNNQLWSLNHVELDDGSVSFGWYQGQLATALESDTLNNFEIESRFWSTAGTNKTHGIHIMVSGSTVNWIRLGWNTYAAGYLGYEIKQNGIVTSNNYFTGHVVTDSAKVYKIKYERSTNQVTFYYKADTNSASWTTLGTSTATTFNTKRLIGGVHAVVSSTPKSKIDNIIATYKPMNYVVPSYIDYILPSDSISVGTRDSSMTFKWTTNADTTLIYNKNVLIKTTIDSVWTLTTTKMDSLNLYGEETFTIKTKRSIAPPDSDKVVLVFPSSPVSGVIRQFTMSLPDIVFKDNSTSRNICIDYGTHAIDSVLIYYRLNDSLNWIYAGKQTIVHTGAIEDTSQFCFNFPVTKELGKIQMKFVENKDTTVYGLRLRNYLNVRVVPPPKIDGKYAFGGCYNWGSGFYAWHDYTCGWVASYHGRVETRVRVYLNKVNPANYIDGREWVIWLDTTNVQINDPAPNQQRDWMLSHQVSAAPTTFTHKGRIYKYLGNGVVNMEDPTNNVEYEVFRYPNLAPGTFEFDNMGFIATSDGNGIILFNTRTASFRAGYVDGEAVYTTLYAALPNGMVFGGLSEPNIGRAEAIFTFTGGSVSTTSRMFRGIHPKIWKWGKENGIR